MPDRIRLARGRFDVGLITGRTEPMLAFWRDGLGLPVERVLEPLPGITQYKLTMHGAVLKINCLDAAPPDHGLLGALRMLSLTAPNCTAAEHVRDPDQNLIYLTPPSLSSPSAFGVHYAVSDENAFRHFYSHILGLDLVGDNMCDVDGAQISWARSPDVVAGRNSFRTGFGYLTFQVIDVVEAHRHACDSGAVEILPPSGAAFTGDSVVSFIADPDGNRIELSQRPDLVAAANAD
jgi:catechol 2,3-dioxygenase-like lactoylglutathione lyase family enzyme